MAQFVVPRSIPMLNFGPGIFSVRHSRLAFGVAFLPKHRYTAQPWINHSDTIGPDRGVRIKVVKLETISCRKRVPANDAIETTLTPLFGAPHLSLFVPSGHPSPSCNTPTLVIPSRPTRRYAPNAKRQSLTPFGAGSRVSSDDPTGYASSRAPDFPAPSPPD